MELMPWVLNFIIWANSLFAAGWKYDPVTNVYSPPVVAETGQIVGTGKARR